ncbi:uncharacterized protein LOC132803569 [Ziziphus jujuba]|uniref:Uncharacterized protein LOC132803569 n=1 Tax=Ziziphus jujuba TaxID=326968 RepID=A0ABM4A7T0_ZIZJJ|nr:uncharacterized protein LOC132803569 [Ziziphus jujuba]
MEFRDLKLKSRESSPIFQFCILFSSTQRSHHRPHQPAPSPISISHQSLLPLPLLLLSASPASPISKLHQPSAISTGNWTTLSSWKSQGKELGLELLGFKEKARYLARDKGDNGKAALLESAVGLNLSLAMNVARYLSAESLPGLVDKVKYMKEIFFSGSNGRGLVGKNAHQMMMQLSIPISEDLQQNLSFFEKVWYTYSKIE